MIRLKKRLPVLLMAAVIIPGVIISVTGFYLVSGQRSARLLDVKEDYTNRLFNTGRRIEVETRQLVEAVFQQADSTAVNPGDPESLIEFAKGLLLNHPIMMYPFLLDSEKRFIFPITRRGGLPLPRSPDLEVDFSNKRVKAFYNDGYNLEYRERDFTGAIRAYLKALEASTGKTSALYIYHALGRCYFKLNQFLQAIHYYRTVLTDGPGTTAFKKDRLLHFTTLRQLAAAYKIIGEVKIAAAVYLSLYEEALRYDTPNQPNPFAFFKNEALAFLNRYSRKRKQPGKISGDDDPGTTGTQVREIAELSQLDLSLRWLYFENDDSERDIATLRDRPQSGGADYRFMKLQELFESSDEKARFYRQLKGTLKLPEDNTSSIQYRALRGPYPGNRLYVAIKQRFNDHPRYGTVYFGFLLSGDYIRSTIFPRSAREHLNAPGTMVVSRSLAQTDGDTGSTGLLTVPFQSLFPGGTLTLHSKNSRFFQDRVKKDIRLYYLFLSALVLALVSGSILFYKYISRESELVRLKAEFVDSASHTLKTPLTRMSLMAENVARDWVTGEAQKKEFFNTIMAETGRMSEMIDNMLNFSRIEAGKQYYQPESLLLQEIVRDVTAGYSRQLKEKGFRFDVEIDDQLPPIMLDRKAAKLILGNLLQNAVKYSPDEKFVSVRVFREKDHAVLEVGDRGIGIPKKDLPHIFKKFTRAAGDTVKAIEGSGLGLYLARHAVEAHEGKIKVESTPGQGTFFRVVFPFITQRTLRQK